MLPKQKGALSLRDVEMPVHDTEQVLVRVIEAGVCRTDLEIYEGFYGEAPEESDYLILGHECIGKVEAVGKKTKGLSIDDYVVRTVRRPCRERCINCSYNQVDMCLTGNYVETGIKGLHGDMADYFVDSPDYLIWLPDGLKKVGVLMEPLSVAEKAVRQSFKIQERMRWEPKKALVMGAGPIGLLVSMILREMGINTYVCARSPSGNLKSEIVSNIGAGYIQANDSSNPEEAIIDERFDLIVEASGSAKRVYDAFHLLNTNGVLCLTSVTGGDYSREFPIEKINIDMVLGNKLVFGIVNAANDDYYAGIRDFSKIEKKWPGMFEKLITRRMKPEQHLEAFEKKPEDIKTVIEFA